MDTLFLNPDTWDLDVDANRNIALSTSDYALAQDTASECKLFRGEYRYNTTKGVPYNDIFQAPRFNRIFYESQLEKAALNVPEVAKSRGNVRFETREDKDGNTSTQVGGSIKITTDDGRSLDIGL